MARDLFRVTVDEPNYSKLLGEPLDDEQRGRLPDLETEPDELRIWAINADSATADTYHQSMDSGDGLLFYKVERGHAQDEQTYVGTGVIGAKFQTSAGTADRLFDTTTARLAFTVEEFSPLLETTADVEELLGYDSYPQRTHRVIRDRYSSVGSVLTRLRDC